VKFIFLLIFFSVGVMAQVVENNTNNFEPVGGNLNLNTITIITNPCEPPNPYPCAFEPNTVCIDDGNGQTHCECADGYVKDDRGICRDLCYNVECSSETTCNENIIEGKAICLKGNSNSKDGVLFCTEENLKGNCYLYTENLPVNYWFPKSIKALNGWEMYYPFFNDSGKMRGAGALYSNGEIININDYLFSFEENGVEWERKIFFVQPANYEKFSEYYGSQAPYTRIKYYNENYNYEYEYELIFSKVIRGLGNYDNLDYFELPTRKAIERKNVNIYTFDFLEIHTLNLFENIQDLGVLIITKKDDDLSDGLIICGDNHCNSFDYHLYYHDNAHYSKNWPIDVNGYSSSLITSPNTIYLHEDLEALACPKVDSELKECKKINPEYTYNSWSEITGGFIPEFLIVQPASKKELEKFSGGAYSIIYEDSNYSGNSIVYWKKDERYPCPMRHVKSIFSSEKVHAYLGKGHVQNAPDYYINTIFPNDRYVHTTDSTPWEFEGINYDDYGNINYGNFLYSIIIKDVLIPIKNDGVKIEFKRDVNGNKRIEYYPKLNMYSNLNEVDINMNEIDEIYIYDGWEVYFCKDEERDNCFYYLHDSHHKDSDGNEVFIDNETSTIKFDYGGSEPIKYILVQPIYHSKINQFYGHKEYNEQTSVNALEGYAILYRNMLRKDCIKNSYSVEDCAQKEILFGKPGKTFKIGVDTIIKPNEVKAIKVVGSFYVIDNQNNYMWKSKTFTYPVSTVVFKGKKPTVTISVAGDTYSESVAHKFLENARVNASNTRYYNHSDYFFYEAAFNEDKAQNQEIDNGDLLLIDTHNAWNGTTTYSSVLGRSDRYQFHSSDSFEGGALGDYETDWLLTTGCDSIGKDDGSRPAVVNSYKQMFINGLHGVGGFRGLSCWPSGYFGGNYNDEVDEFWNSVTNGGSIAQSWMNSFFMFGSSHFFGKGCARFPGYISPGSCYKRDGISYFSDYYWGTGDTKADPDRKFINNNGICYISYDDDFSTRVSKHIDYDSSNVLIGDTYEQNNLNQEIIKSISSYIGKSENIKMYSNKITFNKDVDDYLFVEGNNVDSILTDSLIKELRSVVDDAYDSIFTNILKNYNYEISSIKTIPLIFSHFNNENVNDYNTINEIVFNFTLSYKGYPFIEKNFITIGINPETKEITTIKSRLLALRPVSTINNSQIENYFAKLIETDEQSYTISYILTEDETYHVAILSFNKLTVEFNIIKVY